MKPKNEVTLHVKADMTEIDEAKEKIRVLKESLQELKTSIDELSSVISSLNLKISVNRSDVR